MVVFVFIFISVSISISIFVFVFVFVFVFILIVCHFDILLEVYQGLHEGHLNSGDDWKKSVCTMNTVYTRTKSKKKKQETHDDLSFFIRKTCVLADLAISGHQ